MKTSLIKNLFFLLVLLVIFQLRPINGQVIKEAQNRKCLQVTQNGGLTTTPPDPVSITATGKGFPNNTDIEIEFCQPSDKKTQCEVVTKTKSQLGNVNVSFAMGGLQGHVPYSIYGTWPFKQVEMGGASGDQQGTFTFLDQGNCVSITWDPYGRIFDSQSLEPIPNVKVGVFDSLNPETLSQVRDNPQKVLADGAFNFLTKPGTYYLQPLDFPKIYTFSEKTKLNNNYRKAYSKRDGSSSIYKPGIAIVEKAGVPEHRDIPLDPGNNPPSHFPIVNIPGYYTQMVFNSMTEYGGRISHPLSIVVLVGKDSMKEVSRVTADKFGIWKVAVNNSKIPENESLLVKLIKVDLTTNKFDEKKAVLTNDVMFEPILRNISGYVFDNNGKKLVNSRVSVVLDSNGKVYSETKTDNNGVLNIPTNNLPVLSYHLAYKSGDKSISLLTTSFANRNKEYLKENNKNLMLNIYPGAKLPANAKNVEINLAKDKDNLEDNKYGGANNNIFFAIAICMLAVVTALIVVYLNVKKKSSSRRRVK